MRCRRTDRKVDVSISPQNLRILKTVEEEGLISSKIVGNILQLSKGTVERAFLYLESLNLIECRKRRQKE